MAHKAILLLPNTFSSPKKQISGSVILRDYSLLAEGGPVTGTAVKSHVADVASGSVI